ncbi:MAG: TlpA disulfide reductase family protein [Parafilimonas sp.]
MKQSFLFLLSFITIINAYSQNYQPDSLIDTYSQDYQPDSLNIGAVAPSLYIDKWIKGIPIEKFERGNVYVIELWATWCAPCIAMMPQLSGLACKYAKDSITIIGVDIDGLEKKTTVKKIQAFVDSMGKQMDYTVAIEDSNFMETDWLTAFDEQSIPKSFVVDGKGTIAWIGHPKNLDEVLYKIANNTWNKKEALARRNLENRLYMLDDSIREYLNTIDRNVYPPYNLKLKDSVLVLINEMVKKETILKYAPSLSARTFDILLITDPHKAYVFGRELFEHPGFIDLQYGDIIQSIQWYSDKLNLPPEIYELGAEACQIEIDAYGKFGNISMYRFYNYMADMYGHGKNKDKAIEYMQKAIEALKKVKNFSVTGLLAAYESQLQQYKNM